MATSGSVLNAMQSNGDGSKIWFTEFGYSSNVDGSHQVGGPNGQAALLHETFAKIRSWNFVPVALWYALNDIDGATGVEKSFGLYDTSGVLKPAATAFAEELTTIAPPPPTPTLDAPAQISPINTTTSRRVNFAWAPVAGAKSYHLWANLYGATDSPGAINIKLPASVCSATRCSYATSRTTAGPYLISGPAEWWITAVDANGITADSSGSTFTIR
jgi:hypothetical protein